MSLEYIRKTYRVPARRGVRVEYTGSYGTQLGTIRSAKGARLSVLIDGDKHRVLLHPTWELRYLDAGQGAKEG